MLVYFSRGLTKSTRLESTLRHTIYGLVKGGLPPYVGVYEPKGVLLYAFTVSC